MLLLLANISTNPINDNNKTLKNSEPIKYLVSRYHFTKKSSDTYKFTCTTHFSYGIECNWEGNDCKKPEPEESEIN